MFGFFYTKLFDKRADKLSEEKTVERQMTVIAKTGVDEKKDALELVKKFLRDTLENVCCLQK